MWRIVRAVDRTIAFSGIRAMEYGARWNSPRLPAVYVASHLSLAALELLANATFDTLPSDYIAIELEIPSDLAIERVDVPALPSGWQEPDHPACAACGDSWLRRGRTVVFDVPSAVLPVERNFVLNPAHPDFSRIRTDVRELPFRFDSRIIGLIGTGNLKLFAMVAVYGPSAVIRNIKGSSTGSAAQGGDGRSRRYAWTHVFRASPERVDRAG